MKKLTILGIALLGASAYLGLSCSSDDDDAAATTTTGGQGTAGTTATGGSGQAGNAQAGSGTGGASNAGNNAGGAINITSTGGLALTDSYYDQAGYHGYCYTVTDGKGSRIAPPCSTDGNSGPCFTNALCVAGFGDAAGSDYSHWGASIGCNLGQPSGTNTTNTPVDVTGKTTVNVSVAGTTVPPAGMRIQLNVPTTTDAGTATTLYFCGDMPTGGSIPLTSLRTECWQTGGAVFDPATMRPDAITVQVSTVQTGTTPFDFCVATLSIT